MTAWRLVTLATVGVLLAAACGGSSTDSSAGSPSPTVGTPAGSVEVSAQPAESERAGAGAEAAAAEANVIDETLALDVGEAAPSVDANVPAEAPPEPIGRPGYTRYVYTLAGGEVIPALVEGPRGQQIRCQVEALPCSFDDLVALRDSTEPLPAELGLSAAELDALIGELAALRTTLDRYVDVDEACAAGYWPDQKQTPNMGSHFTNLDLIDARFDPAEPEILLYTRAGGVEPAGALGECVGDVWVGDEVEIVGAAYFMPRVVTGPDHFDGFTGELDNWHIHYNLCRLDGRDVTVLPADCGPGTPDGPVDQPRGDASEGWMIHAWAEPRHDNQLGVFSMWNPTLWPVAAPSTVAARGSLSGATDGTNVITDFELPDVTVDRPGTLRFFNADGEAHTVTAGSPTDPSDLFDTGVIAGSDANEISISEPGTYSYFCEIHPTMQGTITVG